MSALSKKLNASFNDYESLGARQTISLTVELAGDLDIEALKNNISQLPKQFVDLYFTPTLNIIHKKPSLKEVSEIFSKGQNLPLEFHLVGEKGLYFFVGLYHHSFCDGLGGLEIFRRIVEPKLEPSLARENEAKELFDRDEIESYSLIKGLRIGAKYIGAKGESRKLKSSSLDERRKVTVVSRPIKEVRELKNKLGCTTNELYLFGISQVLRTFFPDGLNRTALVPVNLRPRGLKTTLGNFILVVPVELPASEEFDLKALKQISAALGSPDNLNAYRSARSFVLKLPRFLRIPTFAKLARSSTCIATHVPDGVTARELCGARIVSEFGMPALLPGQEIGFCLITTKDEFSVGITLAGGLIDSGSSAKRSFEHIFQS